MIFCNRIKAALFVHRLLEKEIPKKCVALHGNMTQEARNQALEAFRCGQAQYIACTDVAARGLHCSRLAYIVNWDFPGSIEQYAHRVGRAGRVQGSKGHALTFFTRNFVKVAPAMVSLLGHTNQSVRNPSPHAIQYCEAGS